jgi:ATP-binding cassette subfamily C protein CydD
MNLDPNLLRQAIRERGLLALTILLGALGGVLVVLQARLLTQVIGAVFLDGLTLAQVAPWLGGLLALIGGRALLTYLAELSAGTLALRLKTALRAELMAHLTRLGPAYVRGERSGELTHTAVEGIEALDAYFSQYLPQLALAALIPLTILAFVLPRDPLSALVLLLTGPLIPFFMILIGGVAAALTRRQYVTLSRLSAYFLDVIQGLPTLKLLGRSRAQIAQIATASERFRQVTMGVLQVTFLSALALELLATLSTAVVAVQIGLRLLYGRLTFADAFFVLLLAPEFYQPLRQLGTRFHAGMSGTAAAARLFAILAEPPPPRPTNPRPLPAPLFPLRLSRVSYTYPARLAEEGAEPPPALLDVELALEAGQRVALVGPSGSGKSTLAALLLGFLTPQDGEITVGGVPLAELDLAAWRAQVAWVPQRPHLFAASAADNIRLARPEADAAAVTAAARLAHADEFIRALPQGYATPLGERGARLSGGQAQRIALARAFLKDAPFLILDEATANLDPESETQLQEALARLLAGRTALLIAHRLNTVSDADRIYVLDGGRVVAQGRHAELRAQGGLYARLTRAYGGAA